MASQTPELADFVKQIDHAIKKVGAPPVTDRVGFLDHQRQQVEGIVEMERRWRDDLIASEHGQVVYELFADHVHTLSSTMSARSYFRERSTAFPDTLGPALVVGAPDWRALAKYRVNYRFISWAMRQGILAGEFATLAESIRKLREEMVILLMPLAISRARIFWGRTPASHLSLKDLLSLTVEGFLTAVDKFVPPFSQSYRSVALGRGTGVCIEFYSETQVRFSPTNRKILYRANKLAGRMSRLDGIDHELMASNLNAEAVREAIEKTEETKVVHRPAFETTAQEVADIMAASGYVSYDAVVGVRRVVGRMVAPADQRPDHLAEVSEGAEKIRAVLPNLSMVQRKLLCMKGMLNVEDVV